MRKSVPLVSRIGGVGVDIVDIRRIAASIARRPQFLDVTFTPAELKRAGRLPERTRSRHLAGLFAAKEAFYKALGKKQRGIGWKDIEVESTRGKAPRIGLKASGNLKDMIIHLSISHDGDYAAAVVVIEMRPSAMTGGG